MFTIITTQILKMLLMIVVGIASYKLRLIDQKSNQSLANLLLMIVNPCVALTAFQVDYEPRLARGLMLSFALALLTHVIGIIISQLMIKKEGNDDFAIERFSAMYSNCGFIGIPLVRSLMGNDGVFYLTAYITIFNILSWTHGVILMTGKTSRKDLRKGLLSPMIIACIVGLITYYAHFRFPEIIGDTLSSIAGMNTPLAMIIAGIAVAQVNPINVLKNLRLYYIIFIKQILIPAIFLACLILIRPEQTVAYTILICAACPVAATCTAFSLRFHKNYPYASQMYAFSTMFSLLTIPIVIYAAERLLG